MNLTETCKKIVKKMQDSDKKIYNTCTNLIYDVWEIVKIQKSNKRIIFNHNINYINDFYKIKDKNIIQRKLQEEFEKIQKYLFTKD